MSAENVETVRRGYEHYIATGDFLEGIVHPDFVWDMSAFRLSFSDVVPHPVAEPHAPRCNPWPTGGVSDGQNDPASLCMEAENCFFARSARLTGQPTHRERKGIRGRFHRRPPQSLGAARSLGSTGDRAPRRYLR
jgi:hypothetical protein